MSYPIFSHTCIEIIPNVDCKSTPAVNAFHAHTVKSKIHYNTVITHITYHFPNHPLKSLEKHFPIGWIFKFEPAKNRKIPHRAALHITTLSNVHIPNAFLKLPAPTHEEKKTFPAPRIQKKKENPRTKEGKIPEWCSPKRPVLRIEPRGKIGLSFFAAARHSYIYTPSPAARAFHRPIQILARRLASARERQRKRPQGMGARKYRASLRLQAAAAASRAEKSLSGPRGGEGSRHTHNQFYIRGKRLSVYIWWGVALCTSEWHPWARAPGLWDEADAAVRAEIGSDRARGTLLGYWCLQAYISGAIALPVYQWVGFYVVGNGWVWAVGM